MDMKSLVLVMVLNSQPYSCYPQDRAIDGYEKLFYDAINGNHLTSEEVLESWRIVDDLLCTGDHCQVRTVPYIYTGGWGPTQKTDFITNWDYPA